MQLMSSHELYDIGTEILHEICFVHNSTQKASPEELQVRIVTIFCIDAFFNIKIGFPVVLRNCASN